jgi:GT2 family glycosyltransferase
VPKKSKNNLEQPINSIRNISEKSKIDNHQFVATIDEFDGAFFHGWVLDLLAPDRSIAISLYAGQDLLAQGTADILRQDLLDVGAGKGKHGFALPILKWIDSTNPIAVHVQCEDGCLATMSHPFEVRLVKGGQIAIDRLEGAYLNGMVTRVSGHVLPERCVLIIDGVLIESASLVAKENGEFTYSFRLPGYLFDGKQHLITVAFIDGVHGQASIIETLVPHMTPWQYLSVTNLQSSYYPLSRGTRDLAHLSSFQREVSDASSTRDLKAITRICDAYAALDPARLVDESFPALALPKVLGKPKVSVIIPVHNKIELTYRCVASLILSRTKCTYEVIIVDDASTEDYALEKIFSNAVIIRNKTNVGFLRTCNKAATTAKGEFLVFLNNDTEVMSSWLDELLSVSERYDRVGIAGAKLLFPDGNLQDAGGLVWDNGVPHNTGRNANALDPEWNYVRQTDYLTGAAMMIPRQVWSEVGGFSEEFAPCYYEDTDIAFKVRAAGYRTFYVPHAAVIHLEGQSHGVDESSSFKRYLKINAPKFKAKWSDSFAVNGSQDVDLWKQKDRGIRFRVLVIDYCTPEPDKNAGAYAAVQEIKLLQAHGFKVTFIPENLAYFGVYTDALQKIGVECPHAPYVLSVEELLQKRGHEFDLIFITRYHVAEKYIDLIRRYTKAKILFNNADLHFLRELRRALADKSVDITPILEIRDNELALMKKVDAILTYNETEHAVIASHNLRSDNIFKCPWVLSGAGHTTPFEKRQDLAFLGSFHHLPNIEAVEFFGETIMPLLLTKMESAILRVYGSNLPGTLNSLESDHLVLEGYVDTLDHVFEKCRVFVVPLLSGAGVKGKVLEAISWGMPMVLSPVAAEATGLVHEHSALIAESPEEWVDCITRLYRDKTLWMKLSKNSLELARTQYSFDGGIRTISKPLEYLGFYGGKPGKYAVSK